MSNYPNFLAGWRQDSDEPYYWRYYTPSGEFVGKIHPESRFAEYLGKYPNHLHKSVDPSTTPYERLKDNLDL